MSTSTSRPHFDASRILKALTTRPGVYRMLDEQGGVLYVGKARNLRNRVASYFRNKSAAQKTRVMVAAVADIEITVTNTENEALILENTLIKRYKPRYNILLRDDKSYPYIYVSTHQGSPRIALHRGPQRARGRYFGPYPSASAVRETLGLLQKIFPIRQCEDSFYRNRSRACLQYQIRRCPAPCVGFADERRYQEDVRHAIMFLEGKNHEVSDELAERMEEAARELDYEHAAVIRDQIASLRQVQEKQYVSTRSGNIDVIAGFQRNGAGCVQIFMIRGGRNLGNRAFYPAHTAGQGVEEIIAAFIPQFYLGKPVPHEILVNCEPGERTLLENVLSQQCGHRVALRHRVRGERSRWVQMAAANAEQALTRHLSSRASIRARLESLQDALALDSLPQRLECFDISHTGGEAPVASCVVYDANGPLKQDYRRFNITDITPGDDFAAMRQALTRRYTRLRKGEGKLPDILLVDGGRGQVAKAAQVLEELQIPGVLLLGVAKGPGRKPGTESLFLPGCRQALQLPPDSPALHLIQQVRDEAHRFAISGHQKRRARARRVSTLETIPGLGPRRRQHLLRRFGGLQGVSRAGVDDLTGVPGISRILAQRVYDVFHHEDA